ncbi:MAG: adenosine-specific kinase [Chloroflexi bacterium]|nr:adenosine-specific kinase [Chloroflexota bacterium]
MEIKTIKIDPKDCQVILGQAHFIKSVEDLHEALVNSVPGIKFGVAFCESSGPCLVRHSGTDAELRKLAADYAFSLACGHAFIILIKEAYPINVLPRVREVPEVVGIYAATANPLTVIVAEGDDGRGILGAIDGLKSKGIETEADVKERKEFLRKIGYKL